MKKGVEYQEYEVKALIGKRLNNGSVEYLVHWKGFRKSQASWTNKIYLEEVKDLIQRYDKTHPEQPKNVQHLTTQTSGEGSEMINAYNETCQNLQQNAEKDLELARDKVASSNSAVFPQTNEQNKRSQERKQFLDSMFKNGSLSMSNDIAQTLSLSQNMNRMHVKLHSKQLVQRRLKKNQKQEKMQRKNMAQAEKAAQNRHSSKKKKFIQISNDSEQQMYAKGELRGLIGRQSLRAKKSKLMSSQRSNNQYMLRSQQFDNLIMSSKHSEYKDDQILRSRKEQALKNKPKPPLSPFHRYFASNKQKYSKYANKTDLIKRAYLQQDPKVKDKLEKQYKQDVEYYNEAIKKYDKLYNWNTIIDNNIELLQNGKRKISKTQMKSKSARKRGRPAQKKQKISRNMESILKNSAKDIDSLYHEKSQQRQAFQDNSRDEGIFMNEKNNGPKHVQQVQNTNNEQEQALVVEKTKKHIGQLQKKPQDNQKIPSVRGKKDEQMRVQDVIKTKLTYIRRLQRQKGSKMDNFLIDQDSILKVLTIREMVLQYPTELIQFLEAQ